MQTYVLLKNECIYAKESFTCVGKQQAYLQEAGSPQRDPMLVLHALNTALHVRAHGHTRRCIQGHADAQTKTPPPLLSGGHQLSRKASARGPVPTLPGLKRDSMNEQPNLESLLSAEPYVFERTLPISFNMDSYRL